MARAACLLTYEWTHECIHARLCTYVQADTHACVQAHLLLSSARAYVSLRIECVRVRARLQQRVQLQYALTRASVGGDNGKRDSVVLHPPFPRLHPLRHTSRGPQGIRP